MDEATPTTVGQWLNRHVFPDGPPPPRASVRRSVGIGVVAALMVAVQLARIWSSGPLNSIWMEDGYVFLADALRWSFFHALATPYSGYLNTVARLVAEPVSALPVTWFAPAMAVAGAAIVTGCAFVVWTASAGYIRTPYLRAALVAVMVLMPNIGVEMTDNVTYAIWFLLFTCFWILLWRPATLSGVIVAGVLIFLTALSNALIVFLLPLWLLRLLAVRDRRDKVIVISYAVGVIIQFISSWNQRALIGEAGGTLAQMTQHAHWHWSLVPAYFQRIVGAGVVGQWVEGYLWVHLGDAFELLLVAAFLVFLVLLLRGASAGTRVLVLLTAGLSLAIFLYSGFQREVGSQFFWPHGQSNVISSHYIVVPTLLLLSALFIGLDAEPGSDSVVTRRGIRIGVVAAVLIGTLVSFRVSDAWIRGRPTWTSQVAAGRAQCEHTTLDRTDLVIAPNVLYSPRMAVLCDKLLGRALSGRHPPLPDLHTVVLRPLDGAILSGRVFVAAGTTDNVPVTGVEIRLSEGSGSERLLGATRLGPVGWILTWNTASVADGTYRLQSVAHDSARIAAKSPWVTVVVRNR